MKIGAFCAMLCLLFCALILFPICTLAGQANIPGFKGSAVKVPVVQAPSLQKSTPVSIPGFYGKTVTLPSTTQLPQLKQPSVSIPGISGVENNPSQNQLIIHQDQPKAIIDWSSFDIGSDAWTHFDQQKNSSWIALNRIWSSSPSLIFGRLTADGKIYLINQNGILFGPGSKVNVNTLVASALNIKDEDFLSDVFIKKIILKQEEGSDRLAIVSNQGEINSAEGGYVFLIGPRVENTGLINSLAGQIGLAAGTDVEIALPNLDEPRNAYYIIIKDDFNNPASDDPTFSNAVNQKGGLLYSDGGTVGMYGNNVDQWGIIRATTAFKNKQGSVELRAAQKVTTGADSKIYLPVDSSIDPETSKPVTVSDTFDIQPVVDIKGLHEWNGLETQVNEGLPVKRIELNGAIEAPTGLVTLSAGERVYLETGSRIDVSGIVAELPTSVISNFKLNSVELRDAYGQKGGVLQGEKITTTLTDGSAIGDLSQLILTQERNALERSIGGATRTIVDEKTGIVTYNNPQIGRIYISAVDGDIIVKEGSVIDFSGGRINYKGGFADTTKLLSGTKIYDISNAPLYIHYDKIMGQYTKTYERFGIRETYNGVYCGGAFPLRRYVSGYTRGGDAGWLSLEAATIILDGRLIGDVTTGVFQNIWTMPGAFTGSSAASDYDIAKSLSERSGLEAPRAGTLRIGLQQSTADININTFTKEIAVFSDTKPSIQLLPDSPLQDGTTSLSAEILNAAGLGGLYLASNLTISTAQDAAIRLQPGGSFSATSRRIDHQGQVTVSGGAIKMIAGQNLTSKKNILGDDNPPENIVDLNEEIILGPESRLDVSGERIDNSMAWIKGIASGYIHTTGGSIAIQNQTDLGQGVFLEKGAVVDVSGGYFIDLDGRISGGSAGLLDVQGKNIKLDGNLKGYALRGEDGKLLGGAVTLRSANIGVAPEAMSIEDTLVLAPERFKDTGFTQINLYSFNDVVIDQNMNIETSLVRLKDPMPSARTRVANGALSYGSVMPSSPDLIQLNESMAFMAGPSSLTAEAGRAFEGASDKFEGNLKTNEGSQAKVLVSKGVVVRTAPAASAATRIANDTIFNPSPVKTGITLKGPNVEVDGTLESRGGNITLQAGSGGENTGNLTMIGAKINAKGYNMSDPASTPKGFAINELPVDGGNVSLSAYRALTLDKSTSIDISGDEPVENRGRSTRGDTFQFREAGAPGSLSLSYGEGITLSDTIVTVKNAETDISTIRGGSLTINRTEYIRGTDSPLKIRNKDIEQFKDLGFDDITLKSYNSIQFDGTIDSSAGVIGRKLTLDAPKIMGDGNDVSLRAPWIVLTNRTFDFGTAVQNETTKGAFTLSGEWIDVIGANLLSGFENVTLKAEKDIRLSEAMYSSVSYLKTGGKLNVTGNLTLDADRIYPSSFYSYKDRDNVIVPDVYSNFTVHSDKKVTIQHTDKLGYVLDKHSDTPIYSALSELTVEGSKGIEIKRGGFLAAPMGKIKMTAPGQRIYLDEGSVVSTAGSGNTAVNYGSVDNNNIWLNEDKMGNPGTPVDRGSLYGGKSITLDADENIIMTGAVIDVSGGGSVFAYKFLPGLEGSNDPLAKTGRYVVFKDNSFQAPGTAVHLKAGGGLSEGDYTLLPLDSNHPENARYAFMPGAYIIETQSGSTFPASGQEMLTKDGFPLTVGYTAVAGTSIRATRPKIYSVRTAAEVLKTEGHYIRPDPLVSGDSGDIKVAGESAVINGVLRSAALDGYEGGKVDLSGKNVAVQAKSIALPEGFDFSTPMPDKLKGAFNLSAPALSGQGLQEIKLGDQNFTDNVTIMEGSVLEAPVISLSANKTITIESGVHLHAIAETGFAEINLNSPAGTAVIREGALLHASHAINLSVGKQDIQGYLKVDNSALTLKGDNIFFVPDGYMQTGHGLYITDNLWSKYSAIDDITLVSGSDIQFLDDFIDNSQISVSNSLTFDAAQILGLKNEGTFVTLNAKTVNLKNSGASSTALAQANAGTFTVNADQINIGSGDILFGGFNTLSLNSQNDVTLLGKGSLTTGNAGLIINAARVTTGTVKNTVSTVSTPITAANFVVYTGTNYYNEQNSLKPANSITIFKNEGTPNKSSIPGGMLSFWGTSINIEGILQMESGTVNLIATGIGQTDGIFLQNGSKVLASGTDNSPGGKVTLIADNGSISLNEGSLIDVSSGAQGDAGVVALHAPIGGVLIKGDLMGIAQEGVGGSFVIDTNELSDTDINGLIGTLTKGGFTESLDMWTRTGNIEVASGQTLKARSIRLTADDNDSAGGKGNINVTGTIDSSHAEGKGRVELYARNNVNINEGGLIDASGTGAGSKGGDVLLSAVDGYVNVNTGSTVDVSGASGTGGTVYLRALRNQSIVDTVTSNDVNINVNGTIKGASAVYAEAVKTYVYDTLDVTDPSIYTEWLSEAGNFYNNNLALGRLGSAISNFHLLPGIEVISSGNINWNTDWDQHYLSVYDDNGNIVIDNTLTRFGGEPGVLTLRAAGDLNINNSIVDHPTDREVLTASNLRDSWAINMTAGADLNSANPLSVIRGKGDLKIKDSEFAYNNAVVYTERAPIRFASGNDTVIGAGARNGYMINDYMKYSMASYDCSIEGFVGRDLIINGGAIQTATGDINIDAGRDIQLNRASGSLGAIRTTGKATATTPVIMDERDEEGSIVQPLGQYWTYAGGGDINLYVGRHLGYKSDKGWYTTLDENAWDLFTEKTMKRGETGISYKLFSAAYGSDYNDAAAGLVTMGGGNLSVSTGGDFLAQAGTFGKGDLSIYAGGNIKGRFLNMEGEGEIHSMGNFGDFKDTQSKGIQVELFKSQMNVTAMGDIQIAAVLNPTLASDKTHISKMNDDFVNCTYNEETSISLLSGNDVTIAGVAPLYHNKQAYQIAETVLPATVNVEAGGDISLLNYFTLTSSPFGNLRLIAGGDIKGASLITGEDQTHKIMMSDVAPEYWYGLIQIMDDSEDMGRSWFMNRTAKDSDFVRNKHGFFKSKDADKQAKAEPLHKVLEDDTEDVKALKNKPIEIHSDKDIKNLNMYFPKKAEVTAGGNILNVTYEGQNNNADDVSKIRAVGDILMDYFRTTNDSIEAQDALEGLVQSGPGVFIVQAGGSIDLGTLKDGIQTIGNGRYPQLGLGKSTLVVSSGYTFDKTAAEVDDFFIKIRTAGDQYAQLMAEGKLDEGAQLLEKTRNDDIKPFLGTPSGDGNINMTASQIGTSIGQSDIYIIAAHDLNLGQTALPISGTVSRKTGITTGGGGAINIFSMSDVNVNESRVMTFYGGDITVWSDEGNINAGRGSRTAVSASPPKVLEDGTKIFSPPAIGSGIRAVTYGENAPEPGNIHLFAPSGIIDAGEAEISGGRIILAAQQVINVQNIIFSAGSVGVPQTAVGTTGIGTLSGARTVTSGTTQLSQETAGIAAAKAAQASQILEDIMTKWLDVKVIDFVQTSEEE
jgi:filamentous hemagglutinin family protein